MGGRAGTHARVTRLYPQKYLTPTKMKNQEILIEGNVVQVGKQKYIYPDDVDVVDEVLNYTSWYNKKTFLYPGGYKKELFSSTWTFKIHIPQENKAPKFDYYSYADFLKRKFRVPSYIKSEWEYRKAADQRACRKIEDIILLNPDMCYFTTLTFDLGKVESYNAAEVEDKFTQWAKNNTYRKGLKYVFVPEHHKVDKEGRLKIHFHGVINDALTLVDSGTRKVEGFEKPVRESKIQNWLQLGKISEEHIKGIVYNVQEWTYGFSTAVKIEKSIKNVVLYVTKYIQKDVTRKNMIFGKRYWSSRNISTLPPIQFENIPAGDFYKLNLKEYYAPYGGTRYKYNNNFVEVIY